MSVDFSRYAACAPRHRASSRAVVRSCATRAVRRADVMRPPRTARPVSATSARPSHILHAAALAAEADVRGADNCGETPPIPGPGPRWHETGDGMEGQVVGRPDDNGSADDDGFAARALERRSRAPVDHPGSRAAGSPRHGGIAAAARRDRGAAPPRRVGRARARSRAVCRGRSARAVAPADARQPRRSAVDARDERTPGIARRTRLRPARARTVSGADPPATNGVPEAAPDDERARAEVPPHAGAFVDPVERSRSSYRAAEALSLAAAPRDLGGGRRIEGA